MYARALSIVLQLSNNSLEISRKFYNFKVLVRELGLKTKVRGSKKQRTEKLTARPKKKKLKYQNTILKLIFGLTILM